MPKRMTYDELVEHPDVQRILGKFVEEGKNSIRRTVLRQGMHHSVLQRRLNRLIEEGVLMKVNRHGRPIKGGRRAPETYYMLLGEHWRTAIKAADINRLREQDLDRMTSGVETTIYGLDVSDFEEEDERKAFTEVLEKIESLTRMLMCMKARVAQARLNETLSKLEVEDVNPFTKWMIEYFAWINLIAPLVGIEHMTLDEFFRKAATAIPLVYESMGELDDEETEELVRCVLRAMKYIYQHRDEYESVIRDQVRGRMRGMVVAHITPWSTKSEASYDRAEDRFRRFLGGQEKWNEVEGPVFEWLKERIPTEEELKSSVVPFRSLMHKYLLRGKTLDELEAHLQRMGKEIDPPFLEGAFRTRTLNPPRAPHIDDVRDYWRSEDEMET